MLSIYTKDTLRASVESISNGNVTVLYNEQGFPQFMTVLEAFKMKDFFGQQYNDFNSEQIAYYESIIGTLDEWHPAFVVDGNVKSHIFVGTFLNNIVGGYANSLPNRQISYNHTIGQHRAACLANGANWRMMNNLEWSALCLKGFLRNSTLFQNAFNALEGNNIYSLINRDDPFARMLLSFDFGLSEDDTLRYSLQHGVPELELTNYQTRTLAGTGSLSWTYFGVSDFIGNVRQLVDGVKMINNRYYMLEANALDISDESTWAELDAYIYKDWLDSEAPMFLRTTPPEETTITTQIWINNEPVTVTLKSGADQIVDIAISFYGNQTGAEWAGIETTNTEAHAMRRQLLDPMGTPFLFKAFRPSPALTQETLKFESMFENIDLSSVAKLTEKFIGMNSAQANTRIDMDPVTTYLARGGAYMRPGSELAPYDLLGGKLLSTHLVWDGVTLTDGGVPYPFAQNGSRLVYIP